MNDEKRITVMCDIEYDSRDIAESKYYELLTYIKQKEHVAYIFNRALITEVNDDLVLIYKPYSTHITISVISDDSEKAKEIIFELIRRVGYKTYLMRSSIHGQKCPC